MTSPSQPTAAYREQSQDEPSPQRGRLVFVGAAGLSHSDDLYPLLRRRLLALSLFLAGAAIFSVAVRLARGPDPDDPEFTTYAGLLLYSLRLLIPALLHLAVAGFLWKRPPRSLLGLRVLEFVIIVPVLGVILALGVAPLAWDYLEAAAREPLPVGRAFVDRYVNAGSFLWFFLITAYGTLIPNTLRRAALITGFIGASPLLLFIIYAGWVRPLSSEIIADVLIGLGVANVIAMVLVLFSTSRIEVLRREAAEARKLGQYVLQEKLGSGGMGDVYRAEHVLLRRPLRPEGHPPRMGQRSWHSSSLRTRGAGYRHAHPPQHGANLRLRPHRGWHVLLRDGIPAG